jgi:CIC family chloride channel protein
MEKIKVSDAMIKKVITVTESISVRNAGLMIKSTTHRGFPVLDNNGRLIGMVTNQDINNALNSGRGDIPVAEIMTKDIVLCYPDETLMDALKKLGERNIGRIPVVEREDPRHLVGLITRKNIIAAYNQVLHTKTK